MKLFSLALLTLLVAATTASAGDYTTNYGSCLAECGSSHGHSWKNGCCTRERSCCDHLWDGYGCNEGCGCDIRLPLPIINWGSLHGCGQPYQMPCLKMPKLHCNHGCDTGCCTAAPACEEACTAPVCEDSCTDCGSHHSCGCHNPLKAFGDHIRSLFACGCHGSCGCDMGCDASCGGHSLNYGTHGTHEVHGEHHDVHGGLPTEAELEAPGIDVPPLPPAPTKEPMDMKKDKKNKKNKKDNKTAGNWLFPNLNL